MTTHADSSSPSGPLDVEALRDRVQLLLDLSLFRQALAVIHQCPNWDSHPEALRQLGQVMQRFAPRSKDRSCAYSFARAMYRAAATSTRDPVLRAEVLAHIGASYFEEGRLEEAVEAFASSRSAVPWKHHAHLGLLAIACATRDLDVIRRRCEDFVEDIPTWHANREAVALLATDPDFAFLRASSELFLECFGGYPAHLQALHDRYCLEALDRALASFDTPERQPLGDGPELTAVVHRTFATVEPILLDNASSVVATASLQARLGL
jgi:tetratricopeptide (TPR) repeat protein